MAVSNGAYGTSNNVTVTTAAHLFQKSGVMRL